MPRTREEILAHADELATRFEDYEPREGDKRDPAPLHALRSAVQTVAVGEIRIGDAVQDARAAGYSWALIGAQLGTSGEAARQKYGRPARTQPS